MKHFAGLDVSVKETSICIVDETGRIVREARVASEPQALLKVLGNPIYRFKRIGLEAGPLSQWLFSALAEAGLPAVCVETRHMQAVLKAQINKTDRNDARGIAQMIRAGLYRPVHVKTLRSQKLRMLLTHRKLLQSKAIAIENDLRGTLRNFGLKVGMIGKAMSANNPMYGPAERCKRFCQPGRCGLASMYPVSDWSMCSGPSWISARMRWVVSEVTGDADIRPTLRLSPKRRAARPRDGVDRRGTYQGFGGHVRAEQRLDGLVMGIVNLITESLI